MQIEGAPLGASDAPEERLRRLEAVIDSSLSELGTEQLLDELLDRVTDLMEVDTAAILLLDEPGEFLVATAGRGLEEKVDRHIQIPIGRGFAGRVAATRRPVVIDDVDLTKVLNPVLIEKGIRSLVGVPMVVEGDLQGVLHVGTLAKREFTETDIHLLQVAADRVALATQARRARHERAAATALQGSLLPTHFPEIAGIEFSARYRASERGGIGGDWYDVFVLPNGRLAVAIGDAMGHGLRAAVVMSRLRSTLRAYAIETTEPADVLTRVDRKFQHFETNELATVLYGVFEPGLDRIRFATAGHPPPLLACPGKGAAYVTLPVDPPLGAGASRARRTGSVDLPPETLLFLYTDGLVERRDVALDAQLDQLSRTVSYGAADKVCAATIAGMLAGEPVTDDVAVLCIRRKNGT